MAEGGTAVPGEMVVMGRGSGPTLESIAAEMQRAGVDPAAATATQIEAALNALATPAVCEIYDIVASENLSADGDL